MLLLFRRVSGYVNTYITDTLYIPIQFMCNGNYIFLDAYNTTCPQKLERKLGRFTVFSVSFYSYNGFRLNMADSNLIKTASTFY